MAVIDVSEASFETEVIERSTELPVVVDFWAQWCGPCRQLGPLLERAAAAREGKVLLAKLDTDANQALAQAFNIRGIPAVKAFKDRKVTEEFVGAQGPEAVERFFDQLVPSEVDLLIESGSEEDLRAALRAQPQQAEAAVRLARILLARKERQQAIQILEPISGSFQADGLRARARLEADELLGEAFAAIDSGQLELAIDSLLAAMATADGRRDDIRQVLVGELDQLGPEHPLARSARSRLATLLY